MCSHFLWWKEEYNRKQTNKFRLRQYWEPPFHPYPATARSLFKSMQFCQWMLLCLCWHKNIKCLQTGNWKWIHIGIINFQQHLESGTIWMCLEAYIHIFISWYVYLQAKPNVWSLMNNFSFARHSVFWLLLHFFLVIGCILPACITFFFFFFLLNWERIKWLSGDAFPLRCVHQWYGFIVLWLWKASTIRSYYISKVPKYTVN